jgi:acetylornithine deacetylase/succinyl-diaminopimelate desuccinylase-like protein
MRNKAKLAKINQLYRDNTDFREYVARYLSQFGDLVESARRGGQEGVLGASFMTSDVGKVYMVLQSALGRELVGVEANKPE